MDGLALEIRHEIHAASDAPIQHADLEALEETCEAAAVVVETALSGDKSALHVARGRLTAAVRSWRHVAVDRVELRVLHAVARVLDRALANVRPPP